MKMLLPEGQDSIHDFTGISYHVMEEQLRKGVKPGFLPLQTKWFEYLLNGPKCWELRVYEKINGNRTPFNERTMRPERPVWVSQGYSGKGRFLGHVGSVVIGTIDEIFEVIDFKKIRPEAESKEEAIASALALLPGRKHIAFEIGHYFF